MLDLNQAAKQYSTGKPSTRLPVADREQISRFANAVFKHASAGQFISLRIFPDSDRQSDSALAIEPVEINDTGLAPMIAAAQRQAQFAATHTKKAVFCPPLAGFSNREKADENHLSEGYTISVECDQYPAKAQQQLEALLGPATLVVASGGIWTDPRTGEVQDKLHLHWTLNEPARGDDLKRLKAARRLAADLVGADRSNVPITHPIRWAGSYHRKGEPRMARIVSESGQDIDLGTALALLEQAQSAKPNEAGNDGSSNQEQAEHRRDDPRSSAELIANITSGREYHPSIVPLAARLIGGGMKPGAVVNHIRELMEAAPLRDFRWQSRFDDMPRMVETAQAKYGRGGEEQDAQEGEPILDPWDEYVVPKFPLEILPRAVQRFVTEQSTVIGCDPSALAMACLANFSGSLDHRFSLRMLRHGSWTVSPRLWVLLVGDPSRKKTPIINTALAELEDHQNKLRAAYEAQLEEHEACIEGWDKKNGAPPKEPPKPPRFVLNDSTVEKIGEILSRSNRGTLVKRDELSGWIGSMEKYARGSGADRAFWLKSFDGGAFTVDRVSRGEIHIGNLSLSLIGGIQPARLAELTGLTSDGLLQRFLPVMLGPSMFPVDAPSAGSFDAYKLLTRRLIDARHAQLILADDALPVMDDLRRHIHELEQVAEGLAGGFQGFIGKLPGLAGSLALILHLAEDPHENRLHPVSRQTAENVRRLVLDFLLPHAFEFYRSAETVTDGDKIQRIASWIVTAKKDRVSSRDLMRNVRDLRAAPLREVHLRVSPLVAGGWLTPESPGPDNRVWFVSPAVAQQLEVRRRAEEARKDAVAHLMGSPRRGQS